MSMSDYTALVQKQLSDSTHINETSEKRIKNGLFELNQSDNFKAGCFNLKHWKYI